MSLRHVAGATLIAVVLVSVRPNVAAQGGTLGPFRWQLRPYCNVLTLTIQPIGSQYRVEGTDDLCGAGRLASVVGLAFPNPNGSIGFGLTSVVPSAATPMHLDATIDLASLGGPWTDSAGNSGAFTFTPGASVAGAVRPLPPGGIAPGSITAAQFAPSALAAAATAAVAAAAAGYGSCPVGQYMRGILTTGVLCEPIATSPSTLTLEPTGGLYSSIAAGSDGFPVVSHQTGGSTLRVTHCRNPSCSIVDANSPDTLTGNTVGLYTSIAVGADGWAIISHQDATAGTLRVTHCSDAACAFALSTTADAVAGQVVGAGTAIAIGSDGLPVIAHRNATTGDLRITHCSTATCSASTTTAHGPINSAPAIAIGADGRPLVAYGVGVNLFVAHCADIACTSLSGAVAVDTPAAFLAGPPSIAIAPSGLPAVAYLRSNILSGKFITGELRLSRCTAADCSSGGTGMTIGPVGAFVAMAFGTDGAPVVAHHVYPNTSTLANAGLLRLTQCLDAACTRTAVTDLDGTGAFNSNRGLWVDLAIAADGLPIVSSRDADAAVLKITKCTSRACQ